MKPNEPLKPHQTWAEVYDFFYEATYGEGYASFTEQTLGHVEGIPNLARPARVIDFGAGTGRLAIPLAQRGYEVTAVEPCVEMLEVLRSKARAVEVDVAEFCGAIADYEPRRDHDIGLCVFTVVSYIVDEETLIRSCGVMADSLKPGGCLIFDVPSIRAFAGGRQKTAEMDRLWTVTSHADGLYTYEENSVDLRTQPQVRYQDVFQIRHWPKDVIVGMMEQRGLVVERTVRMPGSEYLFFRKHTP
jgi:SAM-dependent methyltransferase